LIRRQFFHVTILQDYLVSLFCYFRCFLFKGLKQLPFFRQTPIEELDKVEAMLANPSIHVLDVTRGLLLEGLEIYKNRSDKEYSLTDCISMHVMHREGLREVLTNDHHFTQEGFHILFP
jgi:predicted nucleic acid-binding protein